VVAQDVDRPETAQCRLSRQGPAFQRSDVEPQTHRLVAKLGGLRRRAAEVEIGQDKPHALLGKGFSQAFADPATPAGDESRPALELHRPLPATAFAMS